MSVTLLQKIYRSPSWNFWIQVATLHADSIRSTFILSSHIIVTLCSPIRFLIVAFRYIFNVFVRFLVSVPPTKLSYSRLNWHHSMLSANSAIIFLTPFSAAISYFLLFPYILSIHLSKSTVLRRTFIFWNMTHFGLVETVWRHVKYLAHYAG